MAPASRPKSPGAKRISQRGTTAVLGAGSWGTALAIQFAQAGQASTLWCRDPVRADAMGAAGENAAYLPGTKFPARLTVTADLASATSDVTDIVIAVPSQAFRVVVEALGKTLPASARVAWATKGFELATGMLPHEVAAQLLPAGTRTAVLSGPTFAREVAAGLPAAITVASADEDYASKLAESISAKHFRAYHSTDVIGVEVGGATKNIYAIGAGISDGIGLGANARVALLTRGLAEMTRLGIALGAQRETFMGLAGIGDLVLTCTDDQSRNRRFGLALGRGQDIDETKQQIGQVVEGYVASRSVHQVAEERGIEMPLVNQIYRVLYERVQAEEALSSLMQRPLASELT